jgi:hypothetical protein
MGLPVRRPEGTYFCNLDISGLGRDTVRLCFRKSDAALDEAILRLRRWRSDG